MALFADISAVLRIFLEEAKDLLPYFALSVVFAAFVKTFKWDRRVRASVVKYQKSAIFVATFAGVISPLCSCGILPVVVALSGSGVPIPPVMALLITSPLMSPDSLIVTGYELGFSYAAGKLVVALFTGIFTGFLCKHLVDRGYLPEFPFRSEKFQEELKKGNPDYEDIVNAGCFDHLKGEKYKPGTFGFFLARSRDMTVLTGKFLLIALLIQAAITYYVPSNLVEAFLGSKTAGSVLLATVLSIPLPLHQMVAPPVLKGLIAAGLSPGAAMAVLTGGPVTSIPAMGLLAGMYHRRAFVTYVAVGLTVTILAGFTFQFLI